MQLAELAVSKLDTAGDLPSPSFAYGHAHRQLLAARTQNNRAALVAPSKCLAAAQRSPRAPLPSGLSK